MNKVIIQKNSRLTYMLVAVLWKGLIEEKSER